MKPYLNINCLYAVNQLFKAINFSNSVLKYFKKPLFRCPNQ